MGKLGSVKLAATGLKLVLYQLSYALPKQMQWDLNPRPQAPDNQLPTSRTQYYCGQVSDKG